MLTQRTPFLLSLSLVLMGCPAVTPDDYEVVDGGAGGAAGASSAGDAGDGGGDAGGAGGPPCAAGEEWKCKGGGKKCSCQ